MVNAIYGIHTDPSWVRGFGKPPLTSDRRISGYEVFVTWYEKLMVVFVNICCVPWVGRNARNAGGDAKNSKRSFWPHWKMPPLVEFTQLYFFIYGSRLNQLDWLMGYIWLKYKPGDPTLFLYLQAKTMVSLLLFIWTQWDLVSCLLNIINATYFATKMFSWTTGLHQCYRGFLQRGYRLTTTSAPGTPLLLGVKHAIWTQYCCSVRRTPYPDFPLQEGTPKLGTLVSPIRHHGDGDCQSSKTPSG